jgi:hypothetical protein
MRASTLTCAEARVDDLDMAYERGTRTAAFLFGTGLSYGAVVRGLVAEIGFTPAQAARAATAATAGQPLDRNRIVRFD